MNKIKILIISSIVLLSTISFGQVSDNLMLYRQNFQNISGKNTVSVTSYKKNGLHLVFAGGEGNVDVFSLNKEGVLTPISNH